MTTTTTTTATPTLALRMLSKRMQVSLPEQALVPEQMKVQQYYHQQMAQAAPTALAVVQSAKRLQGLRQRGLAE